MVDRIVLVEGDTAGAGGPARSSLESALLEAGFLCMRVDWQEPLVEAVVALGADLVVLDLTTPGHRGAEACRRLRGDARTSGVSILMVTSPASHQDRVAGLAAGADAYVDQPGDRAEIVASANATLRRAKQLRGLSPLTGLPGNAEIETRLETLITERAPFALLHADLDSFKPYNDHYGFLQGDIAISATARLLVDTVARNIGPGAFVGHIGGDDFALLCAPEQAAVLADAVVAAFDGSVERLYRPEDAARGAIEVVDRQGHVQSHPLLSLSIGIASTAVRAIRSPSEAASIASEMKAVAKGRRGSAWALDRRHMTA